MFTTSENNKRIAKNTLLLYFRMLLTMAVSLYTSRVILSILGIEDFGIFNVVGGVIAMLGFLNSSLSGASSRFITYELGKGDDRNMKKMFSTILCIHFIIAIIILVIGETIGLWFVYNKLVIPTERMTAALWVYHCSILTAIISIISVPYNSLIIAHEKMNAFAYISVVEVIMKLLIVLMLVLFPFDKLIVYAILYLSVQFMIRMIYNQYCTRNFVESRTMPSYHPKQMKEIFVYASWTMNGYLAIVGYTQGINILLNLFFGPIVNAARGIAVQVEHAAIMFVNNFQLAAKPQIIKSYASNNLEYMHTLIVASSKYGFYLMLLISFPVLLCVDPILNIWLGTVPDYTANFVRIMLLTGLLQPLKNGMINGIHATGDIRKFQIFEGTSLLTVLPISYILLKIWHITPEMVMITYLCVELITQGIRIWIVLLKIRMKYEDYFKKVIFPILLPLMSMLFVLYYVNNVGTSISFWRIIVYAICSLLYMIISILFLGLNSSERSILFHYMKKICIRL